MDTYETMEKLQQTIDILADLNCKGIFYQWIAWFMEAIESDIGEDALMTMRDILTDRFEIGGW